MLCFGYIILYIGEGGCAIGVSGVMKQELRRGKGDGWKGMIYTPVRETGEGVQQRRRYGCTGTATVRFSFLTTESVDCFCAVYLLSYLVDIL